MDIEFTQSDIKDPNYLKHCVVGNNENKFPMISPAHIYLTKYEKERLVEYIEKCASKVGQEVPDRVRVDTILTPKGLKILEINTDIPAGLAFCFAGLHAYGETNEAKRIAYFHTDLFKDRTPIFVREGGSAFSQHENTIFKTILPGMSEIVLDDNEWWKNLPTDHLIFRQAGREFVNKYENVWPVKSINKWGTWIIDNKSVMATVNSPLALKGYDVKIASPEVVPTGWVAKPTNGLGGFGICFAGQTINKPGDYYFQEQVEIPTNNFKSIGQRKYGIDILVLKNRKKNSYEFFAFLRICDPNEKLLNISAGGGMVPCVVK